MQGEVSNAFGSINRLAVLKSERKHVPCLVPLCASQFVKDGNVKKSELHYSVAKGVWQGSTLRSKTFCLAVWSKNRNWWDERSESDRQWGFISYLDDLTVSSDDDEADRLWSETGEALKEVRLEIDQSKSCHMRHERTE